jgi:hypothetical protein
MPYLILRHPQMASIKLGGVEFSIAAKVVGLNDVRALAAALSTLDKSATPLTKSFSSSEAAMIAAARAATQAAKEASRAAAELAKIGQSGSTAFRGMREEASGLSNALAAVASGLGSLRLADVAKDAAHLAGRAETLGIVLANIGRNANYSFGELANFESKIKSLNITTIGARDVLAQLARAGLPLEKGAELARMAQDSAVIAGESTAESLKALIDSIVTLNPRLAHFRGVMTSIDGAVRDYTATTGKAANSLTEHDKQLAMLNQTLKLGASIAGTYEASLSSVEKQAMSNKRRIEEAQVAFGQGFLPLWRDVVKTTGKSAEWFSKSADAVKATATAATVAAVGIGTLTAAYLGLNAALSANAALQNYRQSTGMGKVAQGMGSRVLSGIGKIGGPIAIGGVLAEAGYEGYRANEEYKDKRREQQKADWQAEGARGVGMQAAIANLRTLAATTDTSAASQSRLSAAMKAVVSMSGEYATEFSKISTANELLAKASERFPNAAKSINDYVASLYAAAKAESDRGDWAKADRAMNVAFGADKAAQAVELRQLTERTKALEAATQAAGKLSAALDEARAKAVNDPTADILGDAQKQLAALGVADGMDATIRKRAALERIAAMQAVYDKFAAIRKQRHEEGTLDEGAIDQEQRAAELAAVVEINSREQEQLATLAAIKAKQGDVLELVDLRLDRERKAARSIQERLAAEAAGRSPEIAEAESRLLELERERTKQREEAAKREYANAELRQKALAAEAVAEEVYAARVAEQRDKITKLRQREVETAQAAVDKRLQVEERLTEELAKLEDRQTAKTLDAARQRIESHKRATEQVRDFVAAENADLADVRTPGMKDLLDLVQRYSDAIAKASDPAQLEQLQNLFQGRLGNLGDKFNAQVGKGELDAGQARALRQAGVAGIDAINEAIAARRRAMAQAGEQRQADLAIVNQAVVAKQGELAAEQALLAAERERLAVARERLEVAQRERGGKEGQAANPEADEARGKLGDAVERNRQADDDVNDMLDELDRANGIEPPARPRAVPAAPAAPAAPVAPVAQDVAQAPRTLTERMLDAADRFTPEKSARERRIETLQKMRSEEDRKRREYRERMRAVANVAPGRGDAGAMIGARARADVATAAVASGPDFGSVTTAADEAAQAIAGRAGQTEQTLATIGDAFARIKETERKATARLREIESQYAADVRDSTSGSALV